MPLGLTAYEQTAAGANSANLNVARSALYAESRMEKVDALSS